MNFFDKLKTPFQKSPSKNEYFFGLVIDSASVEGTLWGVEGGKLEIINAAKAKYSSMDELIEASNIALDDALLDFQPEPEKVLFGVPDEWLQNDALKPEFLKLLQKLVKEIGVKPLAYVSNLQSVCHFINKTSGVPMTAILVKAGDQVEVSVVKAGKIIGIKTVDSSALPSDIEKALLGFTDIEVLPSKIFIYGTPVGGLEKLKEDLLSFPWMNKLPFLHLPKVEELDSDINIKALCLAGATEIRKDVLYQDEEIMRKSVESIQTSSHLANEALVTKPILAQLSTVKNLIPAYILNSHIQKINLSFFKNLLKARFLLPAVLLILLISSLILLHKAKVTIFVDLRILERESQVIADPNITQVLEEKKTIPGKIVETIVSGSGKGSTTGKKQIGDPAKGTVIIYNKTLTPKNFPSSTTFILDSQTFSLDTAANIASASAVEGGIAFGKVTASVTANFIGPEGNLPAGKELTLKDQPLSSFSAKVDSAFSGGVSKDISIVTPDDQKRLLAQVASDLRRKAKEEIQGKLTAGMKILEEGLEEEIQKQSFSKNINDQATEFSLNITIRYKGTAYNENDLKLIVSKLVETNVPDGYELDLSQTETQANIAKLESGGKLIFTAKFRAKLSPKLNTNELKSILRGKTIDQAAEKLKEIPNVIGSNIELRPNIPIKQFQRLPLFGRNIEIEVTAK